VTISKTITLYISGIFNDMKISGIFWLTERRLYNPWLINQNEPTILFVNITLDIFYSRNSVCLILMGPSGEMDMQCALEPFLKFKIE